MRIFFVNIRVKNSVIHSKIVTVVLKDRTKEIDTAKNNTLSKINTIKQNYKNVKSYRVRCEIYENLGEHFVIGKK